MSAQLTFATTTLFTILLYSSVIAQPKPLRVGVAGLVHGHVGWILSEAKKGTVQLVGIAEPNRDLAKRYAKQYGYNMNLVYNTLDEMLDKTKPEAVTAFNSIFDHLAVVQACAPRNIHVMVEKPLAVNLTHAKEMAALARKHNIHLLTNYETTWYGSNHEAYDLLFKQKAIGDIRKVVVHDGHQGPKEIGVGREFLDWLTDPVQNGGGALIDFGCYGADLITWLMHGERPVSVTAITQQIKPDVYPKVDDEATIILTYPKAQGIIQASWNWPYSRKDMEVYGQTGYVHAVDRNNLRIKLKPDEPEKTQKVEDRQPPLHDPFAYFTAVVRSELKPDATDLSSLEINLVAMEILDAARQSATSGKTIRLSKVK